MTISELLALIESDELGRGIIHSAQARVVAGARVSDVRPLPGARVDLKCAVCRERVCIGPTAVKMVDAGAALACFRCVSVATGIPELEFPGGNRELHRLRG